MSPVLSQLSHQMASRHAAIAAAAASAAVSAMKIRTRGQHLPGGVQHPPGAPSMVNLQNVTGQPVVRRAGLPAVSRNISPVRTTGLPSGSTAAVTGQPVIRGGTALQTRQHAAISPGHAAGSRIVRTALMSPPGRVMISTSCTMVRQAVPGPSAAQIVPRPATATAPHVFNGGAVTYMQSPGGVVTAVRHVKRPSFDACYQHSYKVRAYSPV